MDHLQPVAHLDPNDVPEGFTVTDPNQAAGRTAPSNNGGAGGKSTTTGGNNNSSSSDSTQQQEEQRRAILEQALDSEALARLNRIKLVKPEKALKLSNAIVSMAVSGQVPGRITEGKLIELLERGSAAEARAAHAANKNSIQIQRKKYAMDSDDDEDEDDDL